MSEIAQEAEVCDHCGTDERTLGQLTRRAEAAERERDEARAEVERLRGALQRILRSKPSQADEIADAALAGEPKEPTTIPVDVDLLGVKPVSTDPEPADQGDTGSWRFMRFLIAGGQPIHIRLPGGREFKVVVSSRAGAALAGEASGPGRWWWLKPGGEHGRCEANTKIGTRCKMPKPCNRHTKEARHDAA